MSPEAVIAADTIAAIATAPGRGAIGIIRISGPLVPDIANALLGRLPTPRTACFACFRDVDGSAIDEGLGLYFAAPASFTGEHVLELQGHGGAVVLDLLMQRLLALGCRAALPGEFSERAFLNGKLDIAQAEAVADLIDAATAAAARAAVRSMRGEFSAHIAELLQRLTQLRKMLEAGIDFPDEEIDFASNAQLQALHAATAAAFERVTAAARQGALLRDGLNVVIAGKPNAGKSSLLNRLCGEEVAIVSDTPGTTRDVLRHSLQVDGLTVNLADTAGLRQTRDVIEAEGVRRAHGEISKADLVLYLVEATAPEAQASAPPEEALPDGVPVLRVINKIDLLGQSARVDVDANPAELRLSARTGDGLELLRAQLKRVAGHLETETATLSARRRHLDALQRAASFLERGAEQFAAHRAVELYAEDLRLAQRALSEVTGEFGSEDLLGEIFRTFCIGK